MNNEPTDNIVKLIKEKEMLLFNYLNSHGSKDDAVKIKHLEIIIGHLDSILNCIDLQNGEQPVLEENKVSLTLLLEQIIEPEKISRNNAWELSDRLEIQLIKLVDDTYLFLLLKAQKEENNPDRRYWERYFPKDYPDTLLDRYRCGRFDECKTRLEARYFLEYLLQKKVEEYRYDRAKAVLRKDYLSKMGSILAVLLIVLFISYIKAGQDTVYLLLFVLAAGASGSMLSRALKVGKQSFHAETDKKTAEPPLGIRSLIRDSYWQVIIAQPVIGATAALISFLVFRAGLVQIGGGGNSGLEGYGLVAFLAGYSEAYFIGILDKVGGHNGSSQR